MKIKPEQEKELLRLLNQGSGTAFDQIYNEHKDALYYFALKATNSVDEAKDLVQETFFDLWARKEKIDAGTFLKPYLYTSIKNRFLNKIQKEKRFEHYAGIIMKNVASSYELTPEENLILKENKQFILNKINDLPEKCREIFVLNRLEGCSIPEIAEKLLISPQTVKNQLVKAMKYIKPYQQEILVSSLSILWMLSNH